VKEGGVGSVAIQITKASPLWWPRVFENASIHKQHDCKMNLDVMITQIGEELTEDLTEGNVFALNKKTLQELDLDTKKNLDWLNKSKKNNDWITFLEKFDEHDRKTEEDLKRREDELHKEKERKKERDRRKDEEKEWKKQKKKESRESEQQDVEHTSTENSELQKESYKMKPKSKLDDELDRLL